MILLTQIKHRVSSDLRLKDITFSINNNEFVFIFTERKDALNTLFKILSGRQRPEEGRIKYFEQGEQKSDIFKKEIGVVYHDNILLPDRSLRDNYRFILEAAGEGDKYCNIRLQRVLQLVDLDIMGESFPANLLSHQLVRANIACALLFYPSVIILEDPTSALDEVNARAILSLLEKLRALHMTVVLVSSDQRLLVSARKHRLLYLKEGKIAAEDNMGIYV
ncbi:MAG: ATP-binding cassette domain-containing protein [Bacillota bacterium]